MMPPTVRSVPDVAEELMLEFEQVLAPSTVTEIVLRLSKNGAVSLDALAEMARHELAVLAHGASPVAE
jgi:hypothetical protein